MKILKMTARFGKLENASLELRDGLNIIEAPNESGKSTWCAFIRAMLYGVDTAQRGRAGSVSEKAAANPWSGLSPQGSMEIEHRGRRLTLRRRTANPAAPMRQFSAVYTGTETAFPLTGADCGQELLGVSREVFTRSAFIGQGMAKTGSSPDLEKRISSIVSTGTDDTSLSDAVQRLKAWQRERCYNSRVGLNARLEEQLAQTQEQLRDIQTTYNEARQLREDIALMERSAPGADLTGLTVRLRNAEERERICRAALDDSPFGARDSREVSLELGRAKRECLALLEKSREKYSHAKLIAPALLTALTLALAYMDIVEPNVALVPAAFLGIVTLLSLINAAAAANRRRLAASKRRSILRRWDIADESGFDQLDEAQQKRSDAWVTARDEMLSLRRALEARYSAATGGTEMKRRRLAALEGQLSVLGDARELTERRERLQSCIAENLRQKKSMDLALELLESASREQLSGFSPKLTRRTRELFAKLTHGRYDELEMDEALNISARLTGDSLPHGSEAMSEGARQLLYLCLRIAICELALPKEDSCPLILDDALYALDDKRCRDFLELLHELSRDRQIILFTCHSREASFLRGKAGVYIPEVT